MSTGGMGTILRRYGSSTWAEVVDLMETGGMSLTKDSIENTLLNATNKWKTFQSGVRDGGSLTFKLRFTREGYEEMRADFDSDDNQNYEMIFPDDDETSVEFESLITELGLPVNKEGLIEIDVTLKISGEPEVNSGSAESAP